RGGVGGIGGPPGERRGGSGGAEATQDVAVRIEDADRRHIDRRQTLLPPRLAQQRRRRKDRRSAGRFVGQKGTCGLLSAPCRARHSHRLSESMRAAGYRSGSTKGIVRGSGVSVHQLPPETCRRIPL